MARKTSNRPKTFSAGPSVFERARDEMFQQIMQCGVVQADPRHQEEWFDDTMAYFEDRYHELDAVQLTELRILGERFARPAKSNMEQESASAA